MNWNFDAQQAPDYIRVEMSGAFDNEQFGSMIDDLAAQDYFDIGSRLLFDDTRLELGKMTDLELLKASDTFIDRDGKLAYSKVAIVTSPENLHVGRKFEKITEYGSRAIMQIFDDERAALSWLVGGLATALSNV